MPVLELYSFVFWEEYHGSISITQHWLSSLLYSRLSKAFPKSACTHCYFSDKHRHDIFLTPMDLYNPRLLICHGALGRAGYCSVSYRLDLLTGLPGWTPDLTHHKPCPGHSTEPSPSLSWPCATQVFGTVPWWGALPCLCEVHHLGSWLIASDLLQLLPDGVCATLLSMPAEQNGCRAAVTWWQRWNLLQNVRALLKNLKLHVG